MKSRIPREIKTYNNKIEWLQAVHGRVYYPFMRWEKERVVKYDPGTDFKPWHNSWCEVTVRVLIDPEYGLLLYR